MQTRETFSIAQIEDIRKGYLFFQKIVCKRVKGCTLKSEELIVYYVKIDFARHPDKTSSLEICYKPEHWTLTPAKSRHITCLREGKSPSVALMSRKEDEKETASGYKPLVQGRNMVYGLRAQSPKYDWDQGSEEKAQGSEEWDQGSQGF